MTKLKLSETEAHCVRLLKKNGGQVWVTGGAIRDLLLGLEPHDVDFITDLPPALSAGALTAGGISLVPDRTAFHHGIVRAASFEKDIIDIATLRKDSACDGRHCDVEWTSSIQDDLARRDLTFNAIAATINEEGELGELIDPFHGRAHLASGEIIFVGYGPDRIKEDALRLIRACRFTALGPRFNLPPDMQECIEAHAHLIQGISKERIHDEILKGLSYPCPDKFIEELCRNGGLAKYILQPVSKCDNIAGGQHHNETIYQHLLFTLKAMAVLSDDPIMRLAALLHDIGKPSTQKTSSDGVMHFYQHETEGAKIAYEWMKEYKFAQIHIERVVSLIRWHMFHFEDDTKDKTIRRWLREVGDSWKDLITLRCADRRGNMAKLNKPMITQKMQYIIDKAEELMKSGQPIFDKDLAINGHDLIALGIKPGPIYKEIFQKIWAVILNEPEKNTKDYLLEFVRKRCMNVNAGTDSSTGVGTGTDSSKPGSTGSDDVGTSGS